MKNNQSIYAAEIHFPGFSSQQSGRILVRVARIIGLGNVLDLKPEAVADREMIYQKMVSTARELDRVVRDLNTILEIRKNNSSVITELNLEQELEIVKLYVEKEIKETRCQINANFSKARKIRSVKPYVESILQNLLSNAIKYRHPDRPPVIAVSTLMSDDYVCLTFSDNGLGIDTELFKDKIFNLYQRFHNHVDGKGLGLYLVKTQVQALGGKIEIESKVNVGTIFKVYFKNRPDE
jgi:signal transduction histidine kinase